jgi:hypothetical protein
MMVAIVGEASLPPADRRALALPMVQRTFIGQGATQRTLADTIRPAGSCSTCCPPTICKLNPPGSPSVGRSAKREAAPS